MFANGTAAALELDHCHRWLATPPSGSVRLAVKLAPTRGWVEDRVTAPGSSTSLTVMVTVMEAVALEGSRAVTITV